MKKSDRFLLGLALIYIATVGMAYLYPSPSLIRSTLQPTMPLLSGLVALIDMEKSDDCRIVRIDHEKIWGDI